MAALSFNDGVSSTLRSATPGTPVGDRFLNWVPNAQPIGVAAVHLATGLSDRWNFRTDYTASFEIAGLTASQLEIAARLKIHLINGGSVTVTTEDLLSRVYTATLAPGTEPSIAGPDEDSEYSFAMVARNSAAAVMRCTYRAPSS